MKFTEKELQKYASPISKTEEEKCKNAIRMVSDAMKLVGYSDNGSEIRTYLNESYSFALDLSANYGSKKITLLVQGSYANKTNIPTESDVDVAVILESTFTDKYRSNILRESYGFSEGTFSVESLKDEVEKALNHKFGYRGVERKDKSIRVTGNSYRVDADVVPAYRFRDYTKDYEFNTQNYVGGIEIRPDSGGRIINYPEQHITNGVVKNKETNYNFKRCVRIIKNIKQLMGEKNYYIPDDISSFGLESLFWNVKANAYLKYPSVLRYTIDEIFIFLKGDFINFDKYTEVNAIKPLFNNNSGKESYMRFINDANSFYEYDIQGD